MFPLAQELLTLFKACFAENCVLDDAAITQDELLTLEKLEDDELFENVKILLNSLLLFKKTHCASNKQELILRGSQLEQLLQKLEADVRKHVKLENELKLQLEAAQNRLDQLGSNETKSCKCSALLTEATTNINKLEQALKAANSQVTQLQEELLGKTEELSRLRTCKSPDYFKKRLSDQNLVPAKLLPKRTRHSIVVAKDRLRHTKKSPDPRQSSPYFTKADSIKQMRASSKDHTRSFSDYRTNFTKKVHAS